MVNGGGVEGWIYGDGGYRLYKKYIYIALAVSFSLSLSSKLTAGKQYLRKTEEERKQ